MPADFSTRLPYLIDVPAVLLTIQRSCKEADVIFGGLQVQQLSTTPEQLPRVGVTLSLRGSYSKLKQVLADVLGRFPGATLSRMSLRRGTAPADLEATVALALWGRAAGSPAASTASGPEPGLR